MKLSVSDFTIITERNFTVLVSTKNERRIKNI